MGELFRVVPFLIFPLNCTQRCHHCSVWLLFKEKSLFSCRAKLLQRASLAAGPGCGSGGGSPEVAVGRCWSRSHIPRFLGGRAKPEKNTVSFPVAGLQPLNSHSNRSGGLTARIDPACGRSRQEERSRAVDGMGSPHPKGGLEASPGAAAGRRCRPEGPALICN